MVTQPDLFKLYVFENQYVVFKNVELVQNLRGHVEPPVFFGLLAM